MTHIITRACCNDAACVPVCPVNCIHPTPDEPDYLTAEMLYIDPQSCVDCGACVDVCPVSAIVPDDDLPEEHARYEEINARYFASSERTDYELEPQYVAKRVFDGAPAETLRVAVVGSGPAGCYAAEEILSQRGLPAEVDMFERLPVPWGLLRFGVAPDHQDTKAASVSFSKTIRRQGFRLFLNTEVGKDIMLDELTQRYHAVVYAVGATGDRRLGVPGEDLAGTHSATEFVAWYNGHPEYADRTFDFSSERAVVIGNGNVALDVARILVSDPDSLARTDIADHAVEALRSSNIKEVLVVGRRGPLEAAYTAKELLGLAVPGVDLIANPEEIAVPADTVAAIQAPEASVPLYKAELLQELTSATGSSEKRIVLRFLASPVEIVGDGQVEGLRLARNELVLEDGRVVARQTDEIEEIGCGLVLRSVGYLGRPIHGIPFDAQKGVIRNERGRVLGATGDAVAGLYATGWIKRGPSGVIGTNKWCARETVAGLLDDFVSGRLDSPRADAAEVPELVPAHVDLNGWKQIDELERTSGRSSGRPRQKFVDVQQMLDVARTQVTPQPAAAGVEAWRPNKQRA